MEEREKMILDKLRDEERRSVMLTGFIRENVYEFLIKQKGFREDEIEVDAPFDVFSPTTGQNEQCSVDFIVRVGGLRILAIKCALSALESIERHVLAFSRVAGGIPICVVTSSDYSRVLNTDTGELISEELSAVPDRPRAVAMGKNGEFRPLPVPEERLRMERRILLAFNALNCRLPGACGEGF
ncbi:MAG: hypothetical protein M0033_07210 [Nitrospiraceae bacterium]|nr:hypothetical protein [Nitrospiraceae bacterium]